MHELTHPDFEFGRKKFSDPANAEPKRSLSAQTGYSNIKAGFLDFDIDDGAKDLISGFQRAGICAYCVYDFVLLDQRTII